VARGVRLARPSPPDAQAGFRLTYATKRHTLGRGVSFSTDSLCPRAGPDAQRQRGGRLLLGGRATSTELGGERVHPVFLLDEGAPASPGHLDHLHILLNYTGIEALPLSHPCRHLPELDDRLASRRNRSLYSRLGRRTPHPAGTSPLAEGHHPSTHLRLRLGRAGCEREVPSHRTPSPCCIRGRPPGGPARTSTDLATRPWREGRRQEKKARSSATSSPGVLHGAPKPLAGRRESLSACRPQRVQSSRPPCDI